MRFSFKAALLAVASLVILSLLCSMSYSRLFRQNSEATLRTHLMSEALVAKNLAQAEISLLAQKLVQLLSEESAMRKQSEHSTRFMSSDFVQIAVMKNESNTWVAEWASLRPGYANRWATGSHLKLLQGLPFLEVGPGRQILFRQEAPDGQPLFALLIPISQTNSDERGYKIGVGFFTPTTLAKVMDPFRQTAKEAGVIDDRGFALAFTRQQYAGASLQSHPIVLTLLAQATPGLVNDSTNSEGEEVLFAAQNLDHSNVSVFVAQTAPRFAGGFVSSYLVGFGYALAVALVFVGGLFWFLRQEGYEVFEKVRVGRSLKAPPSSERSPEPAEVSAVASSAVSEDAQRQPKSEKSKAELQPQGGEASKKTDVEECLDKVLKRLQPEFLAVGLKVEKNVGKLGKVRIARGQLETIFEEILKNAMEAVGDSREKIIDIRSRHDTRTLTLQIADSGRGMTESTLEKAFDPFFSFEKQGKEGMGLTVVRGLVNTVGGHVRLESSPQTSSWQRTKVVLELPLAEPLPEEEKTHITLTSEVTRSSIKHNDHRIEDIATAPSEKIASPEPDELTATNPQMLDSSKSIKHEPVPTPPRSQEVIDDEFQIVSRSDSHGEAPVKENLTSERDRNSRLQDEARAHFSDNTDHKKRSLFKESIGEETPDLELSLSGNQLEVESGNKQYKPEIRRPKVRSKT